MTFTKEKNGREKPCLFCGWAELLDKLERNKIDEKKLEGNDKKWYHYQYLGKSKNFFAVLDRYPRVKGDTMIISRKHYTDIADSRLNKFQPTEKDFDFIRRIIGKLKKLTDDKKHGKVYTMSICEHWDSKELGGKSPTEHLHLHLLPRHKDMRTKHPFFPEHIFIRSQDMKFPYRSLGIIKRKILEN